MRRNILRVVRSSCRPLKGLIQGQHAARNMSMSARLSVGSDEYQRYRSFTQDKFRIQEKIKPTEVFAENQTDLSKINVYGFDYDYTLAEYSDEMEKFIYDTALDILIKKYKYPRELVRQPYWPDFFIRGLHYDIKRGLIMKIDDRHMVQLDTVCKGLKLLEKDRAMEELQYEHVPKKVMDESCFRGSGNLQQLTDIFSLPEMMLLANVVDYFTTKAYSYDPSSVFEAVENVVREVHINGHLHNELRRNVDKYLEKGKLVPLINKLKRDGKRLFILTNSGFPSLDVGMTHMLGKDWREAFELVIVGARKPEFFDKSDRPFKALVLQSPEYPVSWDPIDGLKRYEVYCGGCCPELMRLKEWKPREVMYFGDQIYADLQSPNQSNGWYTCAVIHELKREIDVMNSDEFARKVVWVQTLEGLIQKVQEQRDAVSRMHVADWLAERQDAKDVLKVVFNKQFGSVFRSLLQGSYFAARLRRVADIYTSSVMNLMEYGKDRIFFPPRGSHPHEKLVSCAYQHGGFDELIENLLREDRD